MAEVDEITTGDAITFGQRAVSIGTLVLMILLEICVLLLFLFIQSNHTGTLEWAYKLRNFKSCWTIGRSRRGVVGAYITAPTPRDARLSPGDMRTYSVHPFGLSW